MFYCIVYLVALCFSHALLLQFTLLIAIVLLLAFCLDSPPLPSYRKVFVVFIVFSKAFLIQVPLVFTLLSYLVNTSYLFVLLPFCAPGFFLLVGYGG